jgi:hemoglobin/transferrin/lactoferrin receptor protein
MSRRHPHSLFPHSLFNPRPHLLALLLSIACASAQASEPVAIDIPAQSLAGALDTLAAQSGLQIMYAPAAVANKQAIAVKGRMEADSVLRQLLAGSGLEFVHRDGSVAIKAQPAASQGTAHQLAPIVVSATRTAQPLGRVAASVNVVDQEAFAARQAATAGDVMKQLPNVDFGGGPRADGQIPTIRGDQFNNIILLVDGARRSSARVGDLYTPLFLDPYLLAKAEVVRGPASTYGSGGLGGAMVFTTLSASDLLENGQQLGGEAKAGYASGDNAHRYNARLYGRQGKFDWLIAGGYHDFSDIQQPNGGELGPNQGHDSSGLIKAGLQANDRMRLELSHKGYDKTAWETNNPQLDYGQVQWVHIHQRESILSASLFDPQGEKTADARVFKTLTANLRDANTTYQMPGGSALPYPYSKSVMETLGLSAQNSHRFTALQQRLTYGLDIYQDDLTTLAGTTASPTTPVPNPVNPDGKLKVQGVFLQDELNAGQWRIIPSLRYDGFEATPASASLAANSDNHLSPKLAVAWDGLPGTSLYGSYGQAFRAPTLWEMYQNNPNPGFRRFAPNPELKPQTDTTLELGVHFEKRQLAASGDRLRLHAALFQAKAEDLIQSVTIAGTPGAFNSMLQYQNVANATKNGLELSGDYQRGAWRLDLAASRIRIKDDASGANLFSPPDKLTSQLAFAWPATDLMLSWGLTAVAEQDYDATVLRRRKGYAVHDLFLSWQSPRQTFRVDAGITNLFDKQYLSYQQSLAAALTAYEMGRSFNLSASAAF